MPKDSRLYAKFTLGFPNHPKILILSDAAFRCLVEATLWSREQEKDGFLARRLALAKWSLAVLQELCTNDDDNPSLVEREEGWYIHDYAEHQETKADIEARRERNRINGQKGGLAKAKRPGKRVAKPAGTNLVSEKLAEEEEGGARENSSTDGDSEAPTDEQRPPPCPRHPNGNPTDDPCRKCGAIREWERDNEIDVLAAKRRQREADRSVADNCTRCFGTNWVHGPDEKPLEPAVKCNHQEAVNE